MGVRTSFAIGCLMAAAVVAAAACAREPAAIAPDEVDSSVRPGTQSPEETPPLLSRIASTATSRGDQTPLPLLPVMRLALSDVTYDGAQGSYCWPSHYDGEAVVGLCADKLSFEGPFEPVAAKGGDRVAVLIEADRPPSELTVSVFEFASGPRVRHVELDAGLRAEFTIDLPEGTYFAHVGGVWPDGQVGYEFQLEVAGTVAPDADVFLPRQAPPAGPRAAMVALFFGGLVEVDGCLRAQNAHDDYLVIWPHDFSLRVEDDAVSILDGAGNVVVEVGDLVRFSGGEVAFPQSWRDVPAHCPGRYWVMGLEVNRAQDIVLETYEVLELGAAHAKDLRVKGYLLAKSGEPVKLCPVLLESFPPQCGRPHLVVEGADLADFSSLRTEGDVTWSNAHVELRGTLRDGVLEVGQAGEPSQPPAAGIPSCEEYTTLIVSADGVQERATVTCYECRGLHVDSTARSPADSPTLAMTSGARLQFQIGASPEPTTIEIRLYPGLGAYASFFRWPEELPTGVQPVHALQPVPSPAFDYPLNVSPGEYSAVIRLTAEGPVDFFYAINLRVE